MRAALDWLQQEYHLPLLFAGFSFGSSVGLRACCGDERVKGIVALGLPVKAGGREYHYSFLSGCAQPKLFISGDNDEYGPQAAVEAAVAGAAPPATLVMVPGADHFFAGKLEQMQQALTAWLEAQLSAPGDGEMTEALLRTMHEEARSIFHQALRSSSIAAAFDRRFPTAFPFAEYQRIYAVALGKAALPMLEALRARLPKALDGGVCCGPVLPSNRRTWGGVLHRRPSLAQ